MCINNLSPHLSSPSASPPFPWTLFIVFVSCKATLLPSRHPPHWYRSRAFPVPCFHNGIYDIPTGLLHSDRTWVRSWICSVNIGYGSQRLRYVKKPRRLRLNPGLDRGDELCGGARGCARELEICIADNTPGVPSPQRRLSHTFRESPSSKNDLCTI